MVSRKASQKAQHTKPRAYEIQLLKITSGSSAVSQKLECEITGLTETGQSKIEKNTAWSLFTLQKLLYRKQNYGIHAITI